MRFLLGSAVAAAALMLVSIFFLDGRVATAMEDAPSSFVLGVETATTIFEIAVGYPVSGYLWGFLLAGVGVLLLWRRRSGFLPWALLYIGLTQATSRLVVQILKILFDRPRPFEALRSPPWHDGFFTVGDSFPSGHAAQGWSLYFSLGFLFPKLRLPLLAIPLAVSASRVVLGVHYVGDTLGSAAVCALAALGYASLLGPRLRRTP